MIDKKSRYHISRFDSSSRRKYKEPVTTVKTIDKIIMKPLNKLALAISITAKAFESKLDKAGQPYILHCLRVMNNVVGDECTKCAAIMHDLIEDTEYTFADLTKLGFSDKTIGLLHLLTHQKSTDYMEYIKAISINNDASNIKLRDLEDNSNITRLKGLSKKDFDRIEKYHRAYVYLNNK